VIFRKTMLFVALAWLVPLCARADSLVLGEYLPKAQAMYNMMGYYSTVEYTAISATTGHLLAKANAYLYTDAAGVQSMQASSNSAANFTIDVYLTNIGGTIGLDTSSVNDQLSITDHSGTIQFFSTKLLALEFTSGGDFKFLWDKDKVKGAASLASPLPFIGAIVHPTSSVPSSFRTSNASFAPIQANTDVFMTPTPQSGIGGMLLLMVGVVGCGFARPRQAVR
jgi:hypothetical protein